LLILWHVWVHLSPNFPDTHAVMKPLILCILILHDSYNKQLAIL
jgi:hypothetical protein